MKFWDDPLPEDEKMGEDEPDSGSRNTSPILDLPSGDASGGLEIAPVDCDRTGGDDASGELEDAPVNGDVTCGDGVSGGGAHASDIQNTGAGLPSDNMPPATSPPGMQLSSDRKTPPPDSTNTKSKPKYTCQVPGCGKKYAKNRFTDEKHCGEHSGKRVGSLMPQQSGQPRTYAQRNGFRRSAPLVSRFVVQQHHPQPTRRVDTCP